MHGHPTEILLVVLVVINDLHAREYSGTGSKPRKHGGGEGV